MTQLERIQQMEALLDEVNAGIAQLSAASDRDLLPKIRSTFQLINKQHPFGGEL